MRTLDIGIFSDAINQKLDRDLNNLDIANTDIIVEWQRPSSANNYTWYRKYKSGWVEQGGTFNTPTTSNAWGTATINLLIPMKDNLYKAFAGINPIYSGSYGVGGWFEKFSTYMIYHSYNMNGNSPIDWEVKGIVA